MIERARDCRATSAAVSHATAGRRQHGIENRHLRSLEPYVVLARAAKRQRGQIAKPRLGQDNRRTRRPGQSCLASVSRLRAVVAATPTGRRTLHRHVARTSRLRNESRTPACPWRDGSDGLPLQPASLRQSVCGRCGGRRGGDRAVAGLPSCSTTRARTERPEAIVGGTFYRRQPAGQPAPLLGRRGERTELCGGESAVLPRGERDPQRNRRESPRCEHSTRCGVGVASTRCVTANSSGQTGRR